MKKDLVTRRKEEKENRKKLPIKELAPEKESHPIVPTLEEAIEKGAMPRTQTKDIDPLDIIESIDFKSGENTLSIRFSKRHNRMFRVQVFLNDKTEIRPVTYTGASTGYGFWQLLKGALIK